jgi:hypothetical protein
VASLLLRGAYFGALKLALETAKSRCLDVGPKAAVFLMFYKKYNFNLM